MSSITWATRSTSAREGARPTPAYRRRSIRRSHSISGSGTRMLARVAASVRSTSPVVIASPESGAAHDVIAINRATNGKTICFGVERSGMAGLSREWLESG